MARRVTDAPNMSDATLIVSVEDLINRAMGGTRVNTVNFKLIQTILHILARQQRLLQQKVEIRLAEISPDQSPWSVEKTQRDKESETESSPKSRSPTSKRRRTLTKGEGEKFKEVDKGKAEVKYDKKDKKVKEAREQDEKKAKQIEKQEDTEVITGAIRDSHKIVKGEKKMKRADKDVDTKREGTGKVEDGTGIVGDKTDKVVDKTDKVIDKTGKVVDKTGKVVKVKGDKSKDGKEEKKDRDISPKKKTKLPESVTPPAFEISEKKRGKEKVIIVEKGGKADPSARVGIDVVTQSQFALLEASVNQLKKVALPPPLTLPENEQLRSDLARGSASLGDAMQAMQVNARVVAAEDAISRMADLLTQLAMAGALPEDLKEKVDQVRAVSPPLLVPPAKDYDSGPKTRPSTTSRKSVTIDAKSHPSETSARPSSVTASRIYGLSHSRQSTTSVVSILPGVTHDEMNYALKIMKDELTKNLGLVASKAAAAADSALFTVQNISEKLDIAMRLNLRISDLHSLVDDYAEQLNGLDAGLATQMQSFQEQIATISGDLKNGLTQLENVNTNAETVAVMELTERYQDLVQELDSMLHAHSSLSHFQSQLGDELKALVECVEIMREQKCDRDEVLDGLRDKADSSRLAGMLTEEEFSAARADLETRLSVCHDKFERQDHVWSTAVKDLSRLTDTKAQMVDLMSTRDDVQRQLREMDEKLKVLAEALGEPEAALLTRTLALNATCGSCHTPAFMSARPAHAGAPPRLPALRPPQTVPDEPCGRDWTRADDRHICRRWCGGSHTLITDFASRGRAEPLEMDTVMKRYTDFGMDGRLYMMAEELSPCLECNTIPMELVPSKDSIRQMDDGAGDRPDNGPGDHVDDRALDKSV